MCYAPIPGWRAKKENENGKRPIVFRPQQANLDEPIEVPCGKCQQCLANEKMMWAIRISNEASLHDRNCFATFTYASNDQRKLDKEHLQAFFKRLRHRYKFSHFSCGEYGDHTGRPHYHSCIIGEDFLDGSIQVDKDLYSNKVLTDAWGHGLVSIGSLTHGSACYVAGYVQKKMGESFDDSYRTMSRGIGKEWIQRYHDSVRRLNGVVIDGKLLPVPKRYLSWMEQELESVKAHKKQVADERKALVGYEELYRERGAKEAVLNSTQFNNKVNKGTL